MDQHVYTKNVRLQYPEYKMNWVFQQDDNNDAPIKDLKLNIYILYIFPKHMVFL